LIVLPTLNAIENLLENAIGISKYLKPSQTCFKVTEASKTILKVPKPLNATANLLKSSSALYNCIKLSQNCFKLPGASRTILKVL